MGGGLEARRPDFLLAMKRDAADPSMSGFYIPPQILTRPEFEKAAKLFISPRTGHTARVHGADRAGPVRRRCDGPGRRHHRSRAAEFTGPTPHWPMRTSPMVGASVFQNEIRGYYNGDIQYIVLVTLIVVFLILAAAAEGDRGADLPGALGGAVLHRPRWASPWCSSRSSSTNPIFWNTPRLHLPGPGGRRRGLQPAAHLPNTGGSPPRHDRWR